MPARNAACGHEGDKLRSWGQTRLRSLLSSLDDSAAIGTPLVVQFSSMALANNSLPWVRQMASAFAPHDAAIPPLRVVFPTTQEVRDSLEGWLAGSSIPCADSRPAQAVLAQLEREERESGRHDYTATRCKWGTGERARAVPHLKSFTRCADGSDGGGGGGGVGGGGGRSTSAVPWLVIGSHNFSKAVSEPLHMPWGLCISISPASLPACTLCAPSAIVASQAWGELNANRTALLGMKSFELSVLIIPSQLPAGVVVPPLPFLPATPYVPGDTCWQSGSWRSNSVTNGLPVGVNGNVGSVDHHGKTPEEYHGKTTGELIYGDQAAGRRLLATWEARRRTAASRSEGAATNDVPLLPVPFPVDAAAAEAADAVAEGAARGARTIADDHGGGHSNDGGVAATAAARALTVPTSAAMPSATEGLAGPGKWLLLRNGFGASGASRDGVKLVLLVSSPTGATSDDSVWVWFGWDTLIKFERGRSQEPLASLAQRLAPAGMGLDERAARAQWVEGQRVAEHLKPWRNLSEWK